MKLLFEESFNGIIDQDWIGEVNSRVSGRSTKIIKKSIRDNYPRKEKIKLCFYLKDIYVVKFYFLL